MEVSPTRAMGVRAFQLNSPQKRFAMCRQNPVYIPFFHAINELKS